nr:phage N-6-adenine-methyltransferase [Microbacterium sp. XT11]
MFAKRNDRYLTPLPLVRACGEFDLDPCGAPGHPTAATVWTPEEVGDGLSMPWFGRVWLNPPYGRTIGDWVERLFQHGSGVALIPCSPDTKLWQSLVLPSASCILFVRGRVRYVNAARPANHPSALIAVSANDAEILRSTGLGSTYSSVEVRS